MGSPGSGTTLFVLITFLGNFLDRDGILEVIVEFHTWEDFGALLYQIDGQTITQVP